jgi:hypothetical protein
MSETKPVAMYLDHQELVLRMVEASTGMERPEGVPLDRLMESVPAGLYRIYSPAAQAAVHYFAECLGACQGIVGPVDVIRQTREIERETEH